MPSEILDDLSRQRLELFRVLVAEAREYAIFFVEPSGRIASWNAGAERLKGYTAEEIVGQPLAALFPPEDAAAGKVEGLLARAAAEGRIEDEGWRVRKNGSRFWASVLIAAVRDGAGALLGFTKLTRDLTDQRRAGEALRRREEDLAVTLRSVGDGLIATDAEGRVTLVNPVAERLTGWSSEEARGQPLQAVFNIVNEHTRATVENPAERALREGMIVGLANHTLLIARDGTERPIADSASPIRYEDGSVRGVVLIFRDQSAERAAERALRDSEERLRLIVDGVKEHAVFMLDPDGRVASWNRGAERLKGYTAGEIIGQHVSRFYPPEEVARDKPGTLLRAAAEQGTVEDDGWRVRKDGSRFWANVVISALRGEHGELLGFAKVTRDLTERREAEVRQRELIREQAARTAAEAAAEELRRSEERYRAVSERLGIVLEGVSDGITMQDASGRIVYANTQAARMSGYASPDAMLSAPVADFAQRFELAGEDGRPLSYDEIPNRMVLAGKGASGRLLRVRDREQGGEWWSFIQSRPVHDAAGRVDAVVSIWRDVTAERRRQEELAFLAEAGELLSSSLEHETTLRKLAELVVPRLGDWCAVDLVDGDKLRPLAVMHVDPARVALARELAAKYPPDPNQGTGAYHVVRTGVPELYPDIADEMLARGAQSPEHLRILREVGLRSAMIVPITARGVVLGAITMIAAESGRRYGQSDLAQAVELGRRAGLAIDNARLYREARDAIGVRDEFLAIASHELKTPLAALQLQLHGLKRLAGRADLMSDEQRLRDRLEKTAALGNRLEGLVNELLDVSRITAGRLTLERQECDLAAIVADVAERFEDQLAAAGCEMRVRVAERVVGSWDRSRLDQVVTNLLSNAIKYGRGKPIDVAVERAGARARLTVCDRGIGISPEHQARIFGRFERAVSESNYAGFGLGLWIVRQVVEAHGGSVRLDSRAGEGALFTVELPLAPPPAEVTQRG